MPLVEVEKGVRLSVQSLNNSGKRTVVMVHGWPVSQAMYEYQLDVLPKYGFRCVTYDLRGFGDSDKPWRGYSYDRAADDLRAVIESLGLRNVTLVGFSMGGAIAVRYMARHAGFRVKRLALLAAAAPSATKVDGWPYGLAKAELDALILQTYRNRPQMLTDFGGIFFANPVTPSFADWFRGLGLQASGHGTIRAAVALRDEQLWGDMRHIHVPTAVFQGRLDKVVSPECAMALSKGIGGAELHMLEHSGHGVFYDELTTFNTEFLRFLMA